MNTWHYVFFCTAVISVVYLLLHWFCLKIARKDLLDENVARLQEDSIEIYARVESLEYYIRCALSVADGAPLRIVVVIAKDDPRRNEMMAIAETMRRSHKNITYRLD
jgi:hypothetical protein